MDKDDIIIQQTIQGYMIIIRYLQDRGSANDYINFISESKIQDLDYAIHVRDRLIEECKL